jgi:hypothetical protein
MGVRSRTGRLAKIVARLPAALRHNQHDAMFAAARRWSNRELERLAPLFHSPVVNVSAWADSDKEGRSYKNYFRPESDYWITNFGTSQGEMQSRPDEFYLDLEAELPDSERGRFATVFNHTTLEHIWDFKVAFANLCALSSDAIIIVLPWLQPQHSDYGDYWRFSPQAVVRLFEEQGMRVMYLSWNSEPRQSVYVFAIAVRHPERWASHFPNPPEASGDPGFLELPTDFAGSRAFEL